MEPNPAKSAMTVALKTLARWLSHDGIAKTTDFRAVDIHLVAGKQVARGIKASAHSVAGTGGNEIAWQQGHYP